MKFTVKGVVSAKPEEVTAAVKAAYPEASVDFSLRTEFGWGSAGEPSYLFPADSTPGQRESVRTEVQRIARSIVVPAMKA